MNQGSTLNEASNIGIFHIFYVILVYSYVRTWYLFLFRQLLWQICTGDTGHAEAVQLQYDPSKVSATELLEIFFKMHDPTTKNRQGADVGTQYRRVERHC